MSIHISGRLCLMPDEIKKIREAIVKNGGASSLVKMKPQELVNFFYKQTNNMELSIIMSKQFSKAIVSKNQSALKDWASKWLKGEEKDRVINPKTNEINEEYKKIFEKNKDLIGQEKAFEKVVANLEGLEVSDEDIEFVQEKVKILEEESQKVGEGFSGMTKEYLQAKSELNSFLESQNKQNILSFAVKSWGRAVMLVPFSAFLVSNFMYNVAGTISLMAQRRFKIIDGKFDFSTSYKGSYLGKMRWEYIKEAMSIYKKYGIDITRVDYSTTIAKMLIRGEEVESGEHFKRLNKFPSLVFKLMGAVDLGFSGFSRIDNDIVSSRLLADKFFKKNNHTPTLDEYNKKVEYYTKKMLTLNKDQSIDGLDTEEALLVDYYKLEGVEDAKYSSYQKDTKFASKLLKWREDMDSIKLFSKEIPIGSLISPFVKTPANAFAYSVFDNSPIGLSRFLFNYFKGDQKFMDFLENNPQDFSLFKKGILGTIVFLVYLLAKMNDDDDDYNYALPYELSSQTQREFVGKYDAIRIYNTWVSTDYFGVYGMSIKTIANITGKYKKSGTRDLIKSSLADIPLVQDVMKIISYLDEKDQYGFTKKDAIADTLGYTSARVLPMGFIKQLSNFTDDEARRNDYSTWYGQIVGYFPFLREMLPERYDTKGKAKEETPITKLFFGARVGEDLSSDPVVKKIIELDKETGGQLGVSLLGIKEYKNLLAMYESDLVSHEDLIDVFTGTDLAFKVALADYVNNNFDGETDSDKKKSHIESLRKSIMADQIAQHGLEDRYDVYVENTKKKK